MKSSVDIQWDLKPWPPYQEFCYPSNSALRLVIWITLGVVDPILFTYALDGVEVLLAPSHSLTLLNSRSLDWVKQPIRMPMYREYVYSVAVYQKYLMRLGELIIFEPWRFQFRWKRQTVLQTGRKHWGGKRRNCSLRAISPFASVFWKDLYCRHV